MPVPSEPARVWSLVGLVHGQDRITMVELWPLPFRVGRHPALHLTLPAQSVSTEHAEFYADGDGLRLRDLGSTNGTFVNRTRIQDTVIREDDVIHFADLQFQVVANAAPSRPATAVFRGLPSPEPLLGDTVLLKQLLLTGAVTVLFQPIVELPGRAVVGYEALGRGAYPGLPENPAALFHTAAVMGAEVELSRLFRRKVVETVTGRSDLAVIFVNTHPAELSQPGLVDSLAEMSASAPHVEFTVEIHEAAIVKVAEVVALKAALRSHRMRLAYDDFGAGQARLLELGEAPPDLLKFDIRFIRAVHAAPASRRRLLRSLVGMVKDLGAESLAEGVETAEEAEACIEMGFTRAQGYFFGRPAALDKGGPS
jgi:EAL domain-containing protein (putative c-di-GMP-specific phosphodiesterase class I)